MKKNTGYALTIFAGVVMLLIGAWSVLQLLSQPMHLFTIPEEEMKELENKMLIQVAARLALILCGFILVIGGIIKIIKSQKTS